MSHLKTKTVLLLLTCALGCGGGGSETPGKGRGSGRPPRGEGAKGGPPGGGAGPDGENAAAVPVEVEAVERRSVSSFLETNGTLEAENDVSIVARTDGPVVELAVEEGQRVREGQLLLRIEETERLAQIEIAKVTLEEARRGHERAKAARDNEVISQEVYDAALSKLESAEAQLHGAEVLYAYTRVEAPFDGVVVERFVKLGQTVTPNQTLFRLADFDPLLVKIQVPEKELSRLKTGQLAYLNVEAWPDERFTARVLRISPVVETATGTIRVTLEVASRGKLSPGMFASVFLVIETRENALVIPKRALSLETLTDTAFVVEEGQAVRRSLELGFEETEFVEVRSGLRAGERVVVVGQDGLTEGTPVVVLGGPGAEAAPRATPAGAREGGPFGGGGRPDFSKMTPEQLERVKERMRERGLTEEQIKERIERRRPPQP